MRDWVYADLFSGTDEANGSSAIRTERFKLISRYGGEEFYDLIADPHERNELVERGELSEAVETQYRDLKQHLTALHASGR